MIEKVPTGVSLEEFKQLPADERFEVVNGELVEKQMTASFQHINVISNVYDTLRPFAKVNGLGQVYGDGLSYQLSLVADTIRASRIPDVSFIRRERIPAQFDYDGGFPGAPDLAVEVISPSEQSVYILEKISDYLTAGTEQVWLLYPTQKVIQVYSRETPDTVKVYHADDTLEAPTLFPGLQIKVNELFVIGG
jgi:Uma2 family endonuclease